MEAVLQKDIAGSDVLHQPTSLAVVRTAPLHATMAVKTVSSIHKKWLLVSSSHSQANQHKRKYAFD